MCRLYGFRANEETKIECSLVYAQNALMSQSRSDQRGRSHPDGWGIGFYDDTSPHVERRLAAAYEDLHFSETAERVYAQTVLAHVRKATVGEPLKDNLHPFSHGAWMFAHNGTVHPFEAVEPRLRSETDPELLLLRRGSTDSELAFYWLLTRMRQAGVDLESRAGEPAEIARILSESVQTLDRICEAEQGPKPAKLNFVLTDGCMLVASRRRNALYWVQREGVHDCEICGIPHIHHRKETQYRAAVIASEPVTHEGWQEVPEGAVVCIDAEARGRMLEA